MSEPSLASELRVAVGRASRRIRAERGEAALPDNQFTVLLWIEKRGPLTPGQLAELERIQPPSMTRTVNCLAEAGLVAKEAHPTDGRAVVVSLTDAGRAEIAETRRRRDTWLAQHLATLDAEEQAHLAAAADILRRLADS
jgi:DNA-binding MarR family transcriptional regulator